MSYFSPTGTDLYRRRVFDAVQAIDQIESGLADDDLTDEVLDEWDSVPALSALAILAALRRAIDREIVRCISDARIDYANDDWDPDLSHPTWSAIGACLGTTAQAAQQHYGPRIIAHSVTGQRLPTPAARLMRTHASRNDEALAAQNRPT